MDDCIKWEGYIDPKGYGRLGSKKATRVLWEKFYNVKLPSDLHVLHKCDNRICVNLEHLFLGSNADNVADRVFKNRSFRPTGEKNPRAVLTEGQVVEIKKELKYFRRGLIAELGKKYNVKPEIISHIKNGTTWSHILV